MGILAGGKSSVTMIPDVTNKKPPAQHYQKGPAHQGPEFPVLAQFVHGNDQRKKQQGDRGISANVKGHLLQPGHGGQNILIFIRKQKAQNRSQNRSNEQFYPNLHFKIILYSPLPCKGGWGCVILWKMNININSAKSYFTEMIDEVVKGNEYFILQQGKPIAQIIPVKEDALSRAEIVEKLFSYQTLK